MCKVSDKSEIVGEIIGWFDMELPLHLFIASCTNFFELEQRTHVCI